jgi:Phage integrase family
LDAAARVIGEAGLTPHELRHTAASLAIKSGANVKAVQRMLGHASAAMTLDRYADLFDDDLDEVADRLDALRAASRGRVADFPPTDPPSGTPRTQLTPKNRRSDGLSKEWRRGESNP